MSICSTFTSQSLPFNRPRPIQYKLLYKDSALSLFTTSPLYVLRLRRKQSKKMWTKTYISTHWTDLFFQCTRVEQGPTHLLIRLLTCRFQKLRKSPHSTNRDFPHYVCQTVSFSESACAVHLVTCSKRSSRLFVTCEKKSYWKYIESIFSFVWLPIPLIFLTRVGHVKKEFSDWRSAICLPKLFSEKKYKAPNQNSLLWWEKKTYRENLLTEMSLGEKILNSEYIGNRKSYELILS